jgi:hypothetical protein
LHADCLIAMPHATTTPGTMPEVHMAITLRLARRSQIISIPTGLLIIVCLAVVLRLISAAYQGNTVTDLPGIYDQISYDGLAQRVADGFGFSFAEGHWPATGAGEPTAHWSYLYTLYLAAIYKLIGPYPVLARLLQAGIAGIFQTILIWRIGTRLFNPLVGLIAAALNAIYIYFIYYAGALVTETFYITSILWTFDSAFRITAVNGDPGQGSPRRIEWLELGLASGVTLLLRQVFLPFLPFLFLWIWWNLPEVSETQWKRRLRWSTLKGLFLAGVVVGLLILPFTIRNYRAFGTFVLLNTNAGFAFFWGNHPIHGTSFMSVLPGGGTSYLDLIPPELLSLNEAELDRALLERGIAFVVEDPGRYFLLSISRLYDFFEFWPTSESGFVSNLSRVGSFGIALPFIVYGCWMEANQAWKVQSAGLRSAIILLAGFIVIYTLIHLASWTLIRYRLPVDAVLLIFAAFGIEHLINKHIFLISSS